MDPGHFRLGFSVCNLGLAYWKVGRLAEAEALLRRALEIWEAAFGSEHELLDEVWLGLAGVHRDRGRLAESEELFEKVLARLQDSEGDEDPNLAMARKEYAVLLRATGRAEQAAELLGAERPTATRE